MFEKSQEETIIIPEIYRCSIPYLLQFLIAEILISKRLFIMYTKKLAPIMCPKGGPAPQK